MFHYAQDYLHNDNAADEWVQINVFFTGSFQLSSYLTSGHGVSFHDTHEHTGIHIIYGIASFLNN